MIINTNLTLIAIVNNLKDDLLLFYIKYTKLINKITSNYMQ